MQAEEEEEEEEEKEEGGKEEEGDCTRLSISRCCGVRHIAPSRSIGAVGDYHPAAAGRGKRCGRTCLFWANE